MVRGQPAQFNSHETTASWECFDIHVSVNAAGDELTTESKHRFEIENKDDSAQNFDIELKHEIWINRDGGGYGAAAWSDQTAPPRDNRNEGVVTVEAGDTFDEDDMEDLKGTSSWEDDRIYTFELEDPLEPGDKVKVTAYTGINFHSAQTQGSPPKRVTPPGPSGNTHEITVA